jgi:uncharacterized protein YprB with RNaseH-like and TPR domain
LNNIEVAQTESRDTRYQDAYLDIETTGLSWLNAEITVIGVYIVNESDSQLKQLVGTEVNTDSLIHTLRGVRSIFTYNGSRFDLPFIDSVLGIDLGTIANHHDLMYDCWSCNLYGGFKAVELQLGIPRRLQGVTGLDAVLLWQRYRQYGDRKALDLLLEYNKEDVMNLKVLRERLGVEMR